MKCHVTLCNATIKKGGVPVSFMTLICAALGNWSYVLVMNSLDVNEVVLVVRSP